MVLFSHFVILIALGVGIWLAGNWMGYPEVVVIGAVIVLGAGGSAALGDLVYKSGEIHNTTAANETAISNQYESVPVPNRLPIGGVVMILGGMGTVRGLEVWDEMGGFP